MSCSAPFTSTQEDGPVTTEIPVIFSGLQDGARDSCTLDDEDKQQLMSTVNPDVPNFTLLSDSNEEPDIPSSQPRYHVKDMWWPERDLLVPYPSPDESNAETTAFSDSPGGHLQAAQAITMPKPIDHYPEPNSRFKPPSSEEVLSELSVKKFALSTERKIQWAVSLYEEWHKHRIEGVVPDAQIVFADIRLPTLHADNFCYSLSAFLNEVKRSDGFEFGGKGLYSLVVMLQFYLEKQGLPWKLIDNPEFVRVHYTLNNLMKKRAADRVSVTKSATPISFADEEKM